MCVKSSVDIMKYFSCSYTIASSENSLTFKRIAIDAFNRLRSYEERVQTFINTVLGVSAAGSYRSETINCV